MKYYETLTEKEEFEKGRARKIAEIHIAYSENRRLFINNQDKYTLVHTQNIEHLISDNHFDASNDDVPHSNNRDTQTNRNFGQLNNTGGWASSANTQVEPENIQQLVR